MTLYLKYRPKNLDELDLVGVGESLKKILSSESIPHAFLFAGPKGTGKTSAARILAKIVNCMDIKDVVPCEKCESCVSISGGSSLDVIEMDAASHRGIEDIRMLRDAVKLSPVSSKKKVYIIDEAHMLTTEASNALLKTLEEPPEHVVFVLATTNPEKLLDTIKSRTTLVAFKKGGEDELVRALKRVASGEKVKIDDTALKVIATAAGGAFRDAIKIFEQVVSEGKDLTKESLEEYLFSKKLFDLEGFTGLLFAKKIKDCLLEISKLDEKGVSAENFLSALVADLRTKLMNKVGVSEGESPDLSVAELLRLIELMNRAAIDIPASPVPVLPLEIAVIKWCQGAETKDKEGEKTEYTGPVQAANKTSSAVSAKIEEVATANVAIPDNVPAVSSVNLDVTNLEVGSEVWKNILTLVKPINASVEALLRAAKPVAYDGKTLTLGVYYKFHKERLEDSTHRRVLEDIIGQVLNAPTKVICTLTEPAPRKVMEVAQVKPVLTEDKDRDIIKAAEEIFGN